MNSPPPTGHSLSTWQGVIRRYAAYLPVSSATPIVSLNEGNTPLIRAPNFVEAIGDLDAAPGRAAVGVEADCALGGIVLLAGDRQQREL